MLDPVFGFSQRSLGRTLNLHTMYGMDAFVDEQIQSFGGRKITVPKDPGTPVLHVLTIKNGKLIPNMPEYDVLGRLQKVCDILEALLKSHYVPDTSIIMCLRDGFYWESPQIAAFSWSMAKCMPGLIFTNDDILGVRVGDKLLNLDEMRTLCANYEPDTILNDIYFRGSETSKRKTRIRENLAKEPLPFNVVVPSPSHEDIYHIKDHKYILDLPGVKPQSLRLKCLFFMSRVVIRVSFYNPEFGECSYFRQFYDWLFEENVDYVHLVYKTSYHVPLTPKMYKRVLADIKRVYNDFEKHPEKYDAMVASMNKKARRLTVNMCFRYLHKLIWKYHENVFAGVSDT
jgi:hypothetical protein